MQPNQPRTEGVSSSMTNPEESTEAVIVTRLKFKSAASQPARSAVTRDYAKAIAELWSVHSKLPDSLLVLDPDVVEKVGVSVIYSFDVPRQDDETETEEK
jgi:ABC-type phosphate transport system auxiliary subunit